MMAKKPWQGKLENMCNRVKMCMLLFKDSSSCCIPLRSVDTCVHTCILIFMCVYKLKLQYFGHLMRRVDSLEDSDAGRDWGQEEKGTTEDEKAGCHHQLDGREFEWTPGVGDGQGGLACSDSWGHKGLDTTERLNWTELNWTHSTQEDRFLSFWWSKNIMSVMPLTSRTGIPLYYFPVLCSNFL